MSGEDFPKPEAVHDRRDRFGEKQGTVDSVDTPERKRAIPELGLSDRWIIWTRVAKNTSDPAYARERVCIGRVMDDGVSLEDMIPLRLRSLIVKAYFADIAGSSLAYDRKYDSGDSYLKATDESLPEKFRCGEFSDILAWFMRNHPEALADSCKALRDAQARQAQESRKANAPARAARREYLEKLREETLHLTFEKHFNKKRGFDQWQVEKDGVLYVLQNRDAHSYRPGEHIPVEIVRHLVPRKIVLVERRSLPKK